MKEIALQLKISEGTVKSRLNYGRKKIEGEVIKLEKKGTKLYGTSIPIILLFLRIALNGGEISEGQQQGILNNIIGSKNNNSLAPKGDKAHSNLINKSRSIPKEACAKFIVGGTNLCVLGYGGFVYRYVNENAKNSSVAIEKNNSFEDTGIVESNLEEISFDILSYEIAVNNQDGFEKLNEKLAFVISHGSSEAAIKSAAEFQDNFKEYEKLLDKLKNIK